MSSLGFRLLSFPNTIRLGFALAVAFSGSASRCWSAIQNPAVKSPAGQSTSANAALLDRAKALVQHGDPQAALALLDSADLHEAHAADIHALKGVCLALLSQPVESAAEFDAAIALRPNFAPTYFSAGLAFAGFNNLDRALDCFAAALKLDPNLPGLRYNDALVLARAGRFAESSRQVDLELANPRRAESPLDLWRLKAHDAYSQKLWPETLQACRKTLELDPDSPEAYGAMGEALFSLNRTQESLPILEKSEALDPGNAATHALLGKLYQDQGKTQQAIAELEAAQRLRPNDQESLFRLHRLYSRAGDTANASRTLKLLNRLIAARYNESLGESKAAGLNNAGLELEKRGDLAGALNQFDQAAAADATNLIFQRNAALTLVRLGRMDEAVRRLRDILDLDPDDPQTLQILAVAREYQARSPGKPHELPSLEAVR